MSHALRHDELSKVAEKDRLLELRAQLAENPATREWVEDTRRMIRDGSIRERFSGEEAVLRRMEQLRAARG